MKSPLMLRRLSLALLLLTSPWLALTSPALAKSPTKTLTAPVVAVTTAPAPAPAPVGPDRSRPPAVAAPPVFEHPEAQVRQLAPGVELRLIPAPGTAKLSVDVFFRRGSWELAGVNETDINTMGWLWDAATTSRTSDELAVEKDLAQIDLWSSTDVHRSTIGLTVPNEELDKGFELLADVIRNPAFPKDELKLYKRDQLYGYTAQMPNDPASVGGAAMTYAWFPADEPYGVRPDLKALKKVSDKSLRALHQRTLHETPIVVVASGEITLDDLAKRLGPVLEGLGANTEPGRVRATPVPSGETLLAVDLPGAEQTLIRLRTTAPPLKDPDAVAFEAVDWALGGAFLSRLNRNLREEKGWTYGISSAYGADLVSGTWGTRVMVAKENTAEAIAEIRKEIATMIEGGVTAAEIDGCARERLAAWNNIFLDPTSVTSTWTSLLDDETTAAAWRERLASLLTVQPQSTQAAAARWLGSTSPHQWVVVGDRKTIEAELAETGLTTRWITADEAVLGTFERTPTK